MSRGETLEQVLADARGDLPVLRKHGQTSIPLDKFEDFIERVASSAHDYLRFVPEREAQIRSDKSVPWLRARFPEWQRQGNARLNPTNPRERQYRLLIVPVAARISSAQADATATARGE